MYRILVSVSRQPLSFRKVTPAVDGVVGVLLAWEVVPWVGWAPLVEVGFFVEVALGVGVWVELCWRAVGEIEKVGVNAKEVTAVGLAGSGLGSETVGLGNSGASSVPKKVGAAIGSGVSSGVGTSP